MHFDPVERIFILPGPHEPVGIGRAQAFRANGIAHATYPVIVKHLPAERLAAELLCTTLARALGIRVPRPFLADVEGQHALAFASEVDRLAQPVRRLDDDMTARLVNEPWYPAASALDIWAGVEDRIPANLITIGKSLALVDYDDAFQRLQGPHTPTRGELARLGLADLSEFERQQRLRRMEAAILGEEPDWQALRQAMPADAPDGLRSMIDRYIEMLQHRRQYLQQLFRAELNIRQHDLLVQAEETHHERHGKTH